MSSQKAYWIGAYLIFPLLAAIGGWLLSWVTSSAATAAAMLFLLMTLALPAALGRYCRKCGRGLWPSLFRLLILPTTFVVALVYRSGAEPKQTAGLAFLGLASILFEVGWRLTGRKVA